MNNLYAIVRDADANELHFANSVGECQEWCKVHDITGSKGEYIALVEYDSNRNYYEAVDYETII